MNKYTIHERKVRAVNLPGRKHKMIIGPENFGKSKNMCFGVAVFPAKKHAPSHVHDIQEEIIYIINGEGEIYFDSLPEHVEPGSCVYIPPGIEHSIHNQSDIDMKLVYVFSPPTKQGSYDK